MNAWSFAGEHPAAAALLLICALYVAPRFITEPLRLFIAWRRPGDCPRCNGTGREKLKPEGTAKP